MMIRISGSSEGLANYLRTGIKKGEPLTRLERDIPIPLLGSLDVFEAYENFAKDKVDYAGGNNRHITISFSPRDIEKLNAMSEEERIKFQQQLVQDVLNFYLPGYEPEDYVAYAETHRPLTKTESKRKYFIEEEEKNWEVRHPGQHMAISAVKEKYEHIHLATGLYSPTLDKQIRFRQSNLFVDEMFQRYMNEKYGMDNPQNFLQIKKERLDRKDLSQLFANVKSEDDILRICKEYGFKPRLVETKRNRYYSIEYKKQTHNLRGQNFEACEAVTNPNMKPKKDKNMSFKELESWINQQIEIKKADNLKRKGKKMISDEPLGTNLAEVVDDLPEIVPMPEPLSIPETKDEDRSLIKEMAKKPETPNIYDQIKSLNALDVLNLAIAKNWANPRYAYEVDIITNKLIAKDLKKPDAKSFNISISDFLGKPNHCHLNLEQKQQIVADLGEKMANDLAEKKLHTPLYLSVQEATLYEPTKDHVDLVGGFSQRYVETYGEISNIVKKEVYSSAIYYPRVEAEIDDTIADKVAKNQSVPKYLQNPESRAVMTSYGYRDAKHVKKFSNVMCFDIDNSIADQLANGRAFTLDQAYERLDNSRYAGIIATTKSHQKPKVESILAKDKDLYIDQFKDSPLDKSNFLAQYPNTDPNKLSDDPDRLFCINQTDKMRFIVFGKEPFTISKKFDENKKQLEFEKACYNELREAVAKKFFINQFVDKATKDTARVYHKSGEDAIIKPFVSDRVLDFKKMLEPIELRVEQEIRQRQEDKEEKLKNEYDKKLQIPNFTLGQKAHALEIDFNKVTSEIHVPDVLGAYGISYEVRPDKGQEVYQTHDRLLSVTKGTDRDMIVDFKSATQEAFDVRQLILEYSPYQGNLVETFKDFGQRLYGKPFEFLQKNISAAKAYISNFLSSTNKLTKEAFEDGFSQMFGGYYKTKLAQSAINYGKSEGKVVVQFKFKEDLNLDDQTCDQLKELSKNGVLDLQPTFGSHSSKTQEEEKKDKEKEEELEVKDESNEMANNNPTPEEPTFVIDLESEMLKAQEKEIEDREEELRRREEVEMSSPTLKGPANY